MIPFAVRDAWWHNGLAGTIPSAMCFILAGAFLFAGARRAYGSEAAALAVVLLFALNPNMLYLQSTPMTEPLFAASLAMLLWATLWFRESQSVPAVIIAAVASNAASLTRYEGWFFIPFVALYLLWIAKHKWHAMLFGALAAAGPLAWLAHNRFYWGNALEFYIGPWSAIGIYQRALASGMQRYPGDHDWKTAVFYYLTAARLVAGWPILIAAVAGALAAIWNRVWWPLVLLALAPIFYIWSMHSSGTPIFVPELWPNGWYNTRYALAILPLAALAGGALVTLAPLRWRFPAALALAAIPSAAWILQRQKPAICWKESEVNSVARREWTRQAAEFLAANYRHGSGIMFPFGDLTGVLREAGIPLREGLQEGNGVAWNAAVTRPDLFLHEEWALGFSGDQVATAILRANRRGAHYRLRKQIIVKGAPVVEIYQRQ